AAGAAAATSIAELVVTLFQIVVLWKDIKPALAKLQYWKMLLGLVAGTGASFWVMSLSLGSFLSLLFSACLFFAAYGAVLLILREQLTTEMLGQMLGKFLKRKK
ncbi:MAG: polysaccharide biosynthesis C-terminal domain-containing protein, partial [Oscillospiraceae bacterium]|nr:polysaccharide biosynthesis C-terminal domain-containing protein [Oscillospiraceae bacterium]